MGNKETKKGFSGDINIKKVNGGYILTINPDRIDEEDYVFTDMEELLKTLREYIDFN